MTFLGENEECLWYHEVLVRPGGRQTDHHLVLTLTVCVCVCVRCFTWKPTLNLDQLTSQHQHPRSNSLRVQHQEKELVLSRKLAVLCAVIKRQTKTKRTGSGLQPGRQLLQHINTVAPLNTVRVLVLAARKHTSQINILLQYFLIKTLGFLKMNYRLEFIPTGLPPTYWTSYAGPWTITQPSKALVSAAIINQIKVLKMQIWSRQYINILEAEWLDSADFCPWSVTGRPETEHADHNPAGCRCCYWGKTDSSPISSSVEWTWSEGRKAGFSAMYTCSHFSPHLVSKIVGF